MKPRLLAFLLCAMLGFAGATISGLRAQDDGVRVQLPNNSIDEVLSLYEMLTGKRLIRDSNLAGPPLSITFPGLVPRSDAVALIEAALLLNGYSLVPVDENTSKILGSAKSPLGESIPLFADPTQLPETDQLVSYFMLLDFIPTSDALEVFQSYATPRPNRSIVAVPNSNAIVITENTPFVRRLIELKNLIDVPGARTLTEFIPLTRADATRVAEMVNSLLEDEQQRRQREEAQAAPPPQPPAAEPALNNLVESPNTVAAPIVTGGGGSLAPASAAVQVLPDVRTNRILVVAPENRMPYLRRLILDLDSAVALEQPLERPLKFISAGEVLPVLQSLLAEGDDEIAATGPAGGAGLTTTPPAAGAGQTGAGTGLGRPDMLGTPVEDVAPLAVSVGKTRIIADQSGNKIIVIGPPESKNKAAQVLDMLDQRPKQVYLATIIGQLTLSDGLEVGFDYLVQFMDFNPDGLTSGFGALSLTRGVDLLPDPSSIVRGAADTALPLLSGLTIYGTIAETVDIYAKALATSGRFEIISRPVVYTANNKKAVISSGRDEPVPVSTLTTAVTAVQQDTGASIASNIQFKPVVLKLEVIPLINSEDEVTLTIAQQNDNVLERVPISGNEVPVIGTQALTTTITLRNRETVVLGGLITEENQDSRTGIPLLRDIPGLGYLFSTTKKDVRRRELIVMIQPFIINTEDDLAEAQRIERDFTTMSEDLVEFEMPENRPPPVE